MCFRRILLEWVEKLIMTIDEQIRDENLQHREAETIPVLWSSKIDKYEYLTDKELLGSSEMIEQTKFSY